MAENKRLSPKKKTKRALSPPSEAEDFDDPIPAKTSKKQKTNHTFDEPTEDDRGKKFIKIEIKFAKKIILRIIFTSFYFSQRNLQHFKGLTNVS